MFGWPFCTALMSVPSWRARVSYMTICREGLDSGAILHWLGDLEAIHRWQEGYSAMVRRVAQSLGCRILDLRSVFPDSIEEQEKYLCPDGIHPNRLGQRLMYEKAVRPLLAQH